MSFRPPTGYKIALALRHGEGIFGQGRKGFFASPAQRESGRGLHRSATAEDITP